MTYDLLDRNHIFRVFLVVGTVTRYPISLVVPWYISKRRRRVSIAEFLCVPSPDPVERSGSQYISEFLKRAQIFLRVESYTNLISKHRIKLAKWEN